MQFSCHFLMKYNIETPIYFWPRETLNLTSPVKQVFKDIILGVDHVAEREKKTYLLSNKLSISMLILAGSTC